MQTPFSVSLVVPTYNRGHLIEETIRSALGQMEPFSEIVVVDDASTDDTVARLARFGERITLIRAGKGGVQQARNTGVAACGTAYVALCDSDDLLDPEYTRTMRRVVEQAPLADIWYCNFTPFSGDAVLTDKLASAPDGFLDGADRGAEYCVNIPDLYARVLQYQPFFPTGSLFSRRFYQALGGYDPRFNGVGGEDFEFLLRAIASGALGYVTTPLVSIRKHEGNDSRDTLRALNGEAEILEHALARHPGAAQYREAMLESIDKRRRSAFDIAYARGEFSTVRDTASQLRSKPTESNFRLKKAISSLPPMLRNMVWRISQSVH